MLMSKRSASKTCRKQQIKIAEAEVFRRELERCRNGLRRALKRDSELVLEKTLWSIEALASHEDIEALRREVRELRRPR